MSVIGNLPENIWFVLDRQGTMLDNATFTTEEAAIKHFCQITFGKILHYQSVDEIWRLWHCARTNGFKSVKASVSYDFTASPDSKGGQS